MSSTGKINYFAKTFFSFSISAFQHSFVGPVSLSKGCDRPVVRKREASRYILDAVDLNPELNPANLLEEFEYSYRGMKFLEMFFSCFYFCEIRRESTGGHRCLLLYGVDCRTVWIGVAGGV